tara:strand:+ start:86325 stop:87410 length:1086 start_codon:yes stop_codon:yes gene_type:complete
MSNFLKSVTVWCLLTAGYVGVCKPCASAEPVVGGFLFYNEKFIPPPYSIELRDKNTVLINGISISSTSLDLSCYELEAGQWGGSGRWSDERKAVGAMGKQDRGWGNGRRRTPLSVFENVLSSWLLPVTGAGTVVLADGHLPIFLNSSREGVELLRCLRENNVADRDANSLTFLTDENRTACLQLIHQFETSPAFASRASALIDEVDSHLSSVDSTVRMTKLAEMLTFPLTVFAMVVVVLGFGHLLSNKPIIGELAEDEQRQHAKTVVFRSLVIVTLLSCVDLVWTLTASQSGMMRELNPLASKFIHNPMQLVLFKGLGVSVAIVILYNLYQRPIAQAASWWSCLLLTLLTARWLNFNAMFL